MLFRSVEKRSEITPDRPSLIGVERRSEVISDPPSATTVEKKPEVIPDRPALIGVEKKPEIVVDRLSTVQDDDPMTQVRSSLSLISISIYHGRLTDETDRTRTSDA